MTNFLMANGAAVYELLNNYYYTVFNAPCVDLLNDEIAGAII